MTIREVLKKQSMLEIKKEVVDALKQYTPDPPILILKLISLEDGFYDEGDRKYRKLSLREVANPQEYLGVDLVQKGLIPLFDISDNDLIVWNTEKKLFSLFYLIEGYSFKERKDIESIIKELIPA